MIQCYGHINPALVSCEQHLPLQTINPQRHPISYWFNEAADHRLRFGFATTEVDSAEPAFIDMNNGISIRICDRDYFCRQIAILMIKSFDSCSRRVGARVKVRMFFSPRGKLFRLVDGCASNWIS